MNFMYITTAIIAVANAVFLLFDAQYSGAVGWFLVAAYTIALFLEKVE